MARDNLAYAAFASATSSVSTGEPGSGTAYLPSRIVRAYPTSSFRARVAEAQLQDGQEGVDVRARLGGATGIQGLVDDELGIAGGQPLALHLGVQPLHERLDTGGPATQKRFVSVW